MLVLGLSAFFHDSAAALVCDGEIIAAAQEERFTRKKHDASFPRSAVDHCLSASGTDLGDVDCVAFYELPSLKLGRVAATQLANAPRGLSAFESAVRSLWNGRLGDHRNLERYLRQIKGGRRWNGGLVYVEHHISHAASAFYPSPFEEAAVLTIDGVGEWCTTSLGHGVGRDLHLIKELRFPHSLGMLYSAFTQYLGFKVNSGEYKGYTMSIVRSMCVGAC